jgi:ribosomal 50S subunit-associated protein YjgA (DUF615 family)
VTVVEAVVRREAPDIKALGQRLIKLFELAQKTGQTEELEKAVKPARRKKTPSSEASPEPST